VQPGENRRGSGPLAGVRALIPLLVVSLLMLAFSLSSLGSPVRAAAVAGEPLRLSPPRLACGRPRALNLRRFEDGSALLECGDRILARVSVPG
jgi:hypothetical protein